MQVKALRLQDVNYGDQWDEEVEDRWEYNDFRSDSAWREGWDQHGQCVSQRG